MVRVMDTQPQDDLHLPLLDDPSLSRRRFLRGAAIAGGGLIAAGVAACAPAAAPGWTFGPGIPSAPPAPSGSPAASAAASAAPSAEASMSMAPSASPAASASAVTGTIPPGWSVHDVEARNKVRRYLGDLVKALPAVYPEAVVAKLATILGVEDDYPELGMKPAFVQVPNLVLTDALAPLEPTLDGDVKVFNLTVDEMDWRIDELMPSVKALGYNGQWPGPTIRVNQGDKVRAIFKNNLKETTGVHFHGVEFDDFFQDGVPFVTQLPIVPGEEYAYDFVAVNPGSLMYHSHHNATEQVGRGLLGAFIVDPPEAAGRVRPGVHLDLERHARRVHHQRPWLPGHRRRSSRHRARRSCIRFMNEGSMMHPWHSHGFAMDVVARDGIPLGTAGFRATPSA